jgi:hypothetical protein
LRHAPREEVTDDVLQIEAKAAMQSVLRTHPNLCLYDGVDDEGRRTFSLIVVVQEEVLLREEVPELPDAFPGVQDIRFFLNLEVWAGLP